MSIIEYDPATLVQIKVGDLSAPVAAGVEMSKLYVASDEIVRLLLNEVSVDEETKTVNIPPELLPWFKEQRMILAEIQKMTGEVEDKYRLKKMEAGAKIFSEALKSLPMEEKIKIIKELKDGKDPSIPREH